MPDVALKPALTAALRMNEIGTASPYRLCFAGKGNSGASFGFMQGDLAAKQAGVVDVFRRILATAGFADARIKALVKQLSVPTITNPLSTSDTAAVNAALLAESALVDAMDQEILGGVCAALDRCTEVAATAGRTIAPKASLYFALWINMSGPPTKLLTWLSGGEPGLVRPVPGPAATVTAAQAETYLRATSYFTSNPGNFPHLQASVAAGAALLPPDAATPPVAPIAAPPAASVAWAAAAPYAATVGIGDHLVYEQATGHLLSCASGSYDLIATGYSGSLLRHAVNDPDQQCVRFAGPIPRGLYTIGAPRVGPSPDSLPLTPDSSNDMCGRAGFLIHGDSIRHPGDGSDGCIILRLPERQAIVASGLATLVVVDRVSA